MLLSSKSARNPGHYRLFVSTGTRPGQMQKFRDCPGHSGTLGNYEYINTASFASKFEIASLAHCTLTFDHACSLINTLMWTGAMSSSISRTTLLRRFFRRVQLPQDVYGSLLPAALRRRNVHSSGIPDINFR